jgi:hypothetical protein
MTIMNAVEDDSVTWERGGTGTLTVRHNRVTLAALCVVRHDRAKKKIEKGERRGLDLGKVKW